MCWDVFGSFEISENRDSFNHNSYLDSSCTGPRGSGKVSLSSLNMSFVFLMIRSKIFPKYFLGTQNLDGLSSLHLPTPLLHSANQVRQPQPRGHLDIPSSPWLPWVRLNGNLIGQLLAISVKSLTTTCWFPMTPKQAMLLSQASGLMWRDCSLWSHLTF